MAGKRRIISRHLPEEIVEEILYNLPIKTLLRFKCVSKSWFSLISSKAFIYEHLERSIAKENGLKDSINHKLLFTYKDYDQTQGRLVFSLGSSSLRNKPYIEPTLYDHPNPGFEIMGSCNGIILLVTREKLILWNPSTRKYRVIPSHPATTEGNFFHMGMSSFIYGLGYDESNDDYKVVCIRDSKFLGPYYPQTHMYSSKTDSWKRIEHFDKHLKGHYGKFVNGRLHWLPEHTRNRRSRKIFSLHLGEENYQTFSHCLGDYSGSISLVELGGYLGLMNLTRDCDYNVWVMKEYGVRESWSKIFTLSDFLVDRGVRIRGHTRPLCWTKNGDIVVAFGPYVVVCNGKNILHKSRVGMLHHRIHPTVYVQSLVSPFDG